MGEYEPEDSRNVVGTARSQDGRWTGESRAIDANGQPQAQQEGQQAQAGEPFGQHDRNAQGTGSTGGLMGDALDSQFQQRQAVQDSGLGSQDAASGSYEDASFRSGNDTSGTTPGQHQQFAQGSGQIGGETLAGQIREHMDVIGADGVHLATVDHVDGDRIKLTKKDSGAQIEGATGQHQGHHHYLPVGLIAEIEGNTVRLSANADVAYSLFEEEQNRG